MDPPTVTITVRDGVVDVAGAPPGVRVVVWDYDVDGYDESRLETDDAGERCAVTEYS